MSREAGICRRRRTENAKRRGGPAARQRDQNPRPVGRHYAPLQPHHIDRGSASSVPVGFGSLNEDDASDANAVRSDYGRRSPSSEPHLLGAADAQPIERARQSSELVDAGLLRPARECGRDHYRGDVSDPDGGRLSAHAWRLVAGTGGRLASHNRSRPRRRWSHSDAALARGPDLRSKLSRWGASGRAKRDRPARPREPVASRAAVCGPPGARD